MPDLLTNQHEVAPSTEDGPLPNHDAARGPGSDAVAVKQANGHRAGTGQSFAISAGPAPLEQYNGAGAPPPPTYKHTLTHTLSGATTYKPAPPQCETLSHLEQGTVALARILYFKPHSL